MSSANKRHLYSRSLLWGALTFFAVAVTVVQAEPKVTLEISQVSESYKNASLIAGNWIVGVHMNAVSSDSHPKLHGRIPESWKNGRICARSTDISGRYSALTEYEIGAEWNGGLAELSYSKAYESIVNKLNEDNSGVAIHKGGCSAISDQFIPAFWNAEEFPIVDQTGQVELIINLNARRSQQVFARGAVGQTVYTASCAPVVDGGIAFNFQCRLEIPKDMQGEMKFEVWQVRSGIVGKPRAAIILLRPS